ncbi:muscarinic acetylcholine receptor M1 [Protopterus annectens]|uniref:muscarinic acetylcholine receptor M1 n=1 Tax=Protopterus annectens TaxID=7888 RepID=UPI001CFB1CAA|nr:muscarinic acetylcholine receptor M1 [Protopterus annectens]
MNFSNMSTVYSNSSGNQTSDALDVHAVWQVVLIILATGILSLITIIGNILVMAAFKVNSDLKTVTNYFLLSLACADLIIGVISMNLSTTYIIMGQWALGNVACDLWLALDYVASNASVMNLLIISFDRYFSITRPLTYRAKRTPKRAAIMIGLAWAISFILWAPAILFWQYIVGERTVPPGTCEIQFLKEPIITFGTAIAAFYLPVTIMIILYWRIYRETENRAKELAALQGSETKTAHQISDSFKSSSSSETPAVYNTEQITVNKKSLCCSCKRTQSSAAFKPYMEQSSTGSWNHTDEDASSASEDDDKPQSLEKKSKCCIITKFHLTTSRVPKPNVETAQQYCRALNKDHSGRNKNRISGNSFDREDSSICKELDEFEVKTDCCKESRKFLPLKTLLLTGAPKGKSIVMDQLPKKKRSSSRKKAPSLVREKKAAKTLSAILLAFILTWTPYNIMVLVSAFCAECVPASLWNLGYWLCYVNSTVNPMCYALCNKSFRTTFKMLLLCHWDKRKWKQTPKHVAFFQKKAPSNIVS